MIITWLHITLISGFTVLFIVLVLILIIRKKYSQHSKAEIFPTNAERCSIQNGEASFREDIPHLQNLEGSNKPYFCWADHPSLVAQAVENGWPRFSFVAASDDHGEEANVEMSWEVFDESVEYMQKIRMNYETKESNMCVVRAALPLPGPQFANASFPKEAYFEVKILPNHEDVENDHLCDKEKEKEKDESRIETTKLIGDDFNGEDDSECLNRIHSKRNKIEEIRHGGKQECGDDEMVLVGIGLTKGGNLPLKFPGSFLGSVGFNSSGAVCLEGRKLVAESENEEWRKAGNVIGCGYNPAQKKVFFTINSQLVYEIRCKTEDFSHPLYPTLAANAHVTVVVNLGQSPFKFEAANSHRTSNPCFVTTRATSIPTPCYELDSKELFSMGRIDGKWKYWSAKRSCESITAEFDRMSDADLFEIVAR